MVIRRTVPIVLGSVCGFIVLLEYFLKIPWLAYWSKEIQNWGVTVSAFMLALGMVNLFQINVRQLVRRRGKLYNTIALLVGMLLMFVAGIGGNATKEWNNYLFNEVFAPLNVTVFCLLMFSLATACFRGFRAKNLDALVLLISGGIVLLAQAPVGAAISRSIPQAADWILKVPNMAGQRGIIIGAAIGAISMGLRVLVGIETRHLGVD